MPDATSKTIGSRSAARSGWGSVTTTWCRAPPTGMRTPAARPTAASIGPPVSTTRLVAISPALVSTPVTRSPDRTSPVKAAPSSTCTPEVKSAVV